VTSGHRLPPRFTLPWAKFTSPGRDGQLLKSCTRTATRKSVHRTSDFPRRAPFPFPPPGRCPSPITYVRTFPDPPTSLDPPATFSVTAPFSFFLSPVRSFVAPVFFFDGARDWPILQAPHLGFPAKQCPFFHPPFPGILLKQLRDPPGGDFLANSKVRSQLRQLTPRLFSAFPLSSCS